MKRLLNILMLFLLALSFSPGISAAEFGEHPERCSQRYVVTPGKKLNVRTKPSTKGKLIYQLRPGDVVYIDSLRVTTAGGYDWISINDRWGQGFPQTGYVTNLNRFTAEPNPLYDPPTEEQMKIEDAVESSQAVAKWIMLALTIIFAIWFIWAYFANEGKEKLIGYRLYGMRKTFFFNSQPYKSVIYITLFLMAAIAASVVALMAIGGVVFLFLWIVKILCYAVVWIGIILCIACAIATVCGAFVAVVGVLIGGAIWYYDDKIESFAEACADTGLRFFNEFNIFGFTVDLSIQYWQPALIAVATPIALFLALAVIWLLAAGALILFEKIMTKRYSIKHPCPHCQQPSEPATYMSKGANGYEYIPNDIQLRPGMYGLFHITHPVTGERMPTMILNGRDKMPRECANCGKRIQADEGTELHVAMVGTAQSGKSTLTYRMIAEIFSRAGADKVDFTDARNTIRDREMEKKIKSISSKGYISDDDMPAKTAVQDTASTQLIIKRNHLPVPYRLFINDVGGELFDPEHKSQKSDATRFFRNVDSILMMIDPVTTDLSDCDPSDDFKEWVEKFDKDVAVKLRVKDIQDTIDNQIDQHGNKHKRIHLNIVLPKKDLGYIPDHIRHDSQEDLKRYMTEEMGLGDLLNWSNRFASVSFHAIGAISKGKEANITPLIDHVIVGQLGIKI
ncbi:MAG: hypothetical protein K2M27_02795 [Muribaculaceae bacterium]|nr:hypothetical protein [Muribaculaceae bacterium]